MKSNASHQWGWLPFAYMMCLGAVPSHSLEHWAASKSEILNAPCRPNHLPSEAEILNELHAQASRDERVKKLVAGAEIFDTAENIEILEKLSTIQLSIFESAKKKSDRPNIQLSGRCDSLLCVLQDPDVFPKGSGAYSYYLLKNYNLNTAPNIYDRSSPWNAEELQSITRSISNFPAHFFSGLENKQLMHFKRGYTTDGGLGLTFANASIEIFDIWSESDALTQEQVLFHEFGHVIENDLSQDPLWLAEMWAEDPHTEPSEIDKILKRKAYKIANEKLVVSSYAKTNPAEDFAENVVAYRYAPTRFKEQSPKRYELLKNLVFEGLEYTSKEGCQTQRSRSGRANVFLASRVQEESLSESQATQFAKEALRYCGEIAFGVWSKDPRNLDFVSDASLQKCLSRAAAHRWLPEWDELRAVGDTNKELSRLAPRIPVLHFRNEVYAELRTLLDSEFSRFLDELLLKHHSVMKYRGRTENFNCAVYARYSYQSAERLSFNDRFSPSKSLFAWKNSDYFDSQTKEFCEWQISSGRKIEAELGAEDLAQFRAQKKLLARTN